MREYIIEDPETRLFATGHKCSSNDFLQTSGIKTHVNREQFKPARWCIARINVAQTPLRNQCLKRPVPRITCDLQHSKTLRLRP